MVIWFLHNTFGLRNRGIRPRRPYKHNACIQNELGCLERGSRGDIWFLYKKSSFLLDELSTRLFFSGS